MMKKKMILIVTLALLICTLTACKGMPEMIQSSSDSKPLKTASEDSGSSTEEAETSDDVAEFSEEEEQQLYLIC